MQPLSREVRDRQIFGREIVDVAGSRSVSEGILYWRIAIDGRFLNLRKLQIVLGRRLIDR